MKLGTKLVLLSLVLGTTATGAVSVGAEEVQKDGKTYWRVESTDTLSGLGARYGIDYFAIQKANAERIINVNLIYDGDLLLIPTDKQIEAQEVQEAAQPKQETKKEEAPKAEVKTPSYSAPSGAHLTKSGGVFYGPSGKETYYSQKVLPGGGLRIPGRHVAEDGTVRDGDGYICLATPQGDMGNVYQTSLGMGKVYDTNAGGDSIDIYVAW